MSTNPLAGEHSEPRKPKHTLPSTTSERIDTWIDCKLNRAREDFNIINPNRVDISSSSIQSIWSQSSALKANDGRVNFIDFNAALRKAAAVLEKQRRDQEAEEAMKRYLSMSENEEFEGRKKRKRLFQHHCGYAGNVCNLSPLQRGKERFIYGELVESKTESDGKVRPESILRRPEATL